MDSMYKQLWDNFPKPALVIDKNQTVLAANPAAERFFSTSSTILQQKKLMDVLPPTSPALLLVQQAFERSQAVKGRGFDLSLPRAGLRRFCDVIVTPLVEQPDKIIFMVDQNELSEDLERRQIYHDGARAMSGLAMLMAHEIKNPLASIKGATQLLEQNLSEEDRMLSQIILSETERMTRMINRFELFTDERPIALEALNIHRVLGYVKKVLTPTLPNTVQIKEFFDPSLPKISGNFDLLVQAFVNLCQNAVEAIDGFRSDGEIQIHTSYRLGVRLNNTASGGMINLPIEVKIVDNGRGISEAMRSSIFDPFVSSKEHNSGIGLALVAKVIADHNGTVNCDSYQGRTEFKVMLPRA